MKTNTAEKLKRGLTNFMNQLNAAPFFVPASAPPASVPLQQDPLLQKSAATPTNSLSSSAEPATIVNSDSSPLVGLKGPANRWAFARPIGGPLRWGRR